MVINSRFAIAYVSIKARASWVFRPTHCSSAAHERCIDEKGTNLYGILLNVLMRIQTESKLGQLNKRAVHVENNLYFVAAHSAQRALSGTEENFYFGSQIQQISRKGKICLLALMI